MTRCEDHKEMTDKIDHLYSQINEINITLAGFDKEKATKAEVYELQRELLDLSKSIFEVKTSLREIQNNSVEDRESIRELKDTMKNLVLELSLVNKRMDAMDRDYAIIKETNLKMNDFLDTNIWYQFGKVMKVSRVFLNGIKSKSKFLKYLVSVFEYGILIYILWGIISLIMYVTNQSIDLDKLLELARIIWGD